MIEFLAGEQVLLSVLSSGVALVLVLTMTSASPRLLLWVCLAGLIAIFVPWSYVGGGVDRYVPYELIYTSDASQLSRLSQASTERPNVSTNAVLVYLWLSIGVIWALASILRSAIARKRWRSRAIVSQELARYGDSEFANELKRTTIYRVPDSASAFATGILRPEVWIGDGVTSPSQIRAALNHELSHIASNDQLTLLLVVTLERLLWWNPLAWLLGKQARRQMEYACDARCAALLGTRSYRHSLAELFLRQQPRASTLEIPLGNSSEIINRLEKIEMRHTLKIGHGVLLAIGGLLAAFASASLASDVADQPATLIQCHELVPDGVQYDFTIASDIDTRDGQQGALSVTLVDAANPDSTDLPEGAGEFLGCVQKVVGIGDDEGWPGS